MNMIKTAALALMTAGLLGGAALAQTNAMTASPMTKGDAMAAKPDAMKTDKMAKNDKMAKKGKMAKKDSMAKGDAMAAKPDAMKTDKMDKH